MGLGVEFGEQADVANCMMRIACDKAVNGKWPSWRECYRDGLLLTLAGRSFMITPRSIAPEGFVDSDREDYNPSGSDSYLAKLQASQLVVIDDKWLDNHATRIYKI